MDVIRTEHGLSIVVTAMPWAHCEVPSLAGRIPRIEATAAGDGSG